MGIRAKVQNFLDNRKQVGWARARERETKQLLNDSRRRLAQVQHSQILINLGETRNTGYVGNAYRNYDAMVKELDRKYRGAAEWGSVVAKTVVDVRSAFTIGQGVKANLKPKKEGATRELLFIQEFLKHNNLDQEDAQDWASEAELEGKFLARLSPNLEKMQIDVRHIPWIKQQYQVVTPDDDYKRYIRVDYNLNGSGAEQRIDEPYFVYKRFGGRTHNVNETPPKIAMVLTAMENLEKSMWDWRKINHLFASPTPYFKTQDQDQARDVKAGIEAANWKIGKWFVGSAEFSLVSATSQAADVLDREVTTNAKLVSAGVSLPVHFLGFPELMSNRATADNLMELVQAGTNRERAIWIGFYEELFRKVLLAANTFLRTGFDVEAVGAHIPFVSSAKMQEIVTVWLPMLSANAITLKTFLSKVPEVNAEEELLGIQEQESKQLERLKLEADLHQNDFGAGKPGDEE